MSTLSEHATPPAQSPSRALLESRSIFAASARPSTVSVLDADPELAGTLDPATAARAARVARVRLLQLEAGRWRPRMTRQTDGALGMLIIDGLVCRSVRVGSECSSEMLGAGDILRPWADDAFEAVTARPEYEVLSPASVALLDRTFTQAIAPYPEIVAELADRALRRCRSQAVLIATSHIKRVDVRLLAVFWHLAERWGRVTPAGVVVPLKLTHSRLAALVGAQRPSVTTALKRMAARDVLTRNADGHYVLGDSAAEELERLCLSRDARHLRSIDGGCQPLAADR